MLAGTIWRNLKKTLEDNPALSKYVKKVHEIVRYDLVPEDFPCIMLQPISDFAVETDLNSYKRLFLTINIYAYSHYNVTDFYRSVVGDNIIKGVFDINNDIRACLQSSYSLGGTVYDVRLEETSYADAEFPDVFPNRGLKIPAKILYAQQNSL